MAKTSSHGFHSGYSIGLAAGEVWIIFLNLLSKAQGLSRLSPWYLFNGRRALVAFPFPVLFFIHDSHITAIYLQDFVSFCSIHNQNVFPLCWIREWLCKKRDLVQGQETDNMPLTWQVNVKLVCLVLPLAAPSTGQGHRPAPCRACRKAAAMRANLQPQASTPGTAFQPAPNALPGRGMRGQENPSFSQVSSGWALWRLMHESLICWKCFPSVTLRLPGSIVIHKNWHALVDEAWKTGLLTTSVSIIHGPWAFQIPAGLHQRSGYKTKRLHSEQAWMFNEHPPITEQGRWLR